MISNLSSDLVSDIVFTMACLIFDGESSTQQQVIERLLPDEKIDFSGSFQFERWRPLFKSYRL